jgi:glycosyltransferase involved in cell wall biosynthesis
VLDVLRHTWDVSVLGINHFGDPHSYPYPIYPAARVFQREDIFGVRRFSKFMHQHWDLIVILQDPWNFPAYLKYAGDIPVVGWVAVDGKNCRGDDLQGLSLAIFWTNFAVDEARKGGYKGLVSRIPLGVDLKLFHPKDRIEAMSENRIGLPSYMQDGFVLGVVGRNQQRKRLDLAIDYFATWIRESHIEDAYLFLNVAPTGDQGYDIRQLVRYYDLGGKVILLDPAVNEELGDEALPWMYSCFDAQFTTTQGEGWGLCTMEGMACGVPQIVPDWSGLGEWTENAAIKIPCTTQAATPQDINVIGGIADKKLMMQAMNYLYTNRVARATLRERGLALVSRPEYRWENIGAVFHGVLEEFLKTRETPQEVGRVETL